MSGVGVSGKRVMAIYGHPDDEGQATGTLASFVAEDNEVTLVCGRYEGIDQRFIDSHVDEEISLGDYVLLGGEVGALAIIEGVVRLLPGVVGNPESIVAESFRDGLLEEPQYTRPADFEEDAVPDVLISGNHARIAQWRREQREARTKQRRPDLWARYEDDHPEGR